MGLNETASAERIHIGFFGLRNAGKSSLVNAVLGQEASLVSEFLGTTTDPVRKAIELLPLGPCVVIDTPGIDDEGELGELRVKRARQTVNITDIAVLVTDATRNELSEHEKQLVDSFREKKIPFVIAKNKSDLLSDIPEDNENTVYVSAERRIGIEKLKEKLASLSDESKNEKVLVGDIISPGDSCILVVPIDKAAPKGRLILPQQQTIRDILDHGGFAHVCRDTELEAMLKIVSKPKLVITDSQVFGKVSKIVPEDILMTSFSILFARYKGDLATVVRGAAVLDDIRDGDRILISEGCTHHRQCGDIGSVKLPMWIEKYTGKKPVFSFSSGKDFPEDMSGTRLVIHCGGCMLTEREMQYRTRLSEDMGVPITNYGISIAMMNGILKRSLLSFPEIYKILK